MERLGTVAIIGVGLIGGSVGLAVRARGLAERVVGIGRDPARLAEARALGAIDVATTEVAQGVANADVVVVCTPVTRVVDDVKAAADAERKGLLVTDAGSTKQTIVEQVEADPRARAVFVAAHPIAGSEKHGAAHARSDLFEARTCVLTPTEHTPADRLERAREFWASLGSVVLEMSPEAHDRALAITSHLPHAVASALAGVVPAEMLNVAAGAYRDCTRVAAADSALWAGILLENRRPILDALEQFEGRLAELKQLLAAGDSDALAAWWEAARAIRIQYEATGISKPSS